LLYLERKLYDLLWLDLEWWPS